MVRVIDVVVDARQGGGDRVWTYACEGLAEPGDAFLVPLGPRSVMGICTAVYEATEEDLGFPIGQLRSVLNRILGLSLPPPLLDLVGFVANEYLCSLPVAMSAAIPPGAREKLATTWSLTSGPSIDIPLSTAQREVLRTIHDSGGSLSPTIVKKLPASTLRVLRLLRSKGLVEQTVKLTVTTTKAAPTVYSLTGDSKAIENFLERESRKKPAQALTLMRLQTAQQTRLTVAEIRAVAAVTDQTVKALIEAELLTRSDLSSARQMVTPHEPTPHQRLAIDHLSLAVQEGRYEPVLLYGITGSGKTEVFMRVAAEALRMGRQVLYLVPEIALATQVIGRLRERFGPRVAVVHSELSPAERLATWMRIRSGETPIVLGARSALFAPLANLGLIVVDEEHEGAYKQEQAPRYHARRLALRLAEQHRCPVILGSATPSVETFASANSGAITRLDLPERTADARLPEVRIVDLAEGFRKRQPALLSPELIVELDEALRRDEQAIIFLNRRSYAPSILCRECGHQFMCPRCAVSLSLSKKDRRLRCHHCGFHTVPPDKCPSCQGNKIAPVGVGTEKVEEALTEAFPGISIVRLDRDVAQKKGALEDILTRFRTGEHRILVGTQMVAKGLDFPRVTVVGVVVADVSLNLPDFRASERTFQLLTQVAGRAGRSTSPGRVIIQTFNPQHLAIQAAKDHDYERFFAAMVTERQDANYPPFARLVNVLLTGEDRLEVLRASEAAADALEGLPDATILGPVDCALERIQNRWRRHLIVKLPANAPVAEIGARLAKVSMKKGTLVVDVDPYSLV